MQPSGITRTAEIAYVVLILAVAGLVWREASALPPAPYDPLGPKAFPIWVSYALAALGLAMLARLLLGRSLGRAAQAMVVGLEDGRRARAGRPWVAAVTLVLAFAYAAALSVRGVALPAGDGGLSVPVRYRCSARSTRRRVADRRGLRGRRGRRARLPVPDDLQARSDVKAADDSRRSLRAPVHARRASPSWRRAWRSASRSASCRASRPAC